MEHLDRKEALQKAEPFLVIIAFILIVATSLFGLRNKTPYDGTPMTNSIEAAGEEKNLTAGSSTAKDEKDLSAGTLEDEENLSAGTVEDEENLSAGTVEDEKDLSAGAGQDGTASVTSETTEGQDSAVSVTPETNGGEITAAVQESTGSGTVNEMTPVTSEPVTTWNSNKTEPLFATEDEATYYFSEADEDVVSEYAIMIDPENHQILGEKGGKVRIYPASMTKILTLLVGVEHMESLEDTFTMTIDITDYSYVNDCSNAGFEVGEVITVKDLLYGTILPSGADASMGLAIYAAGSVEAFIDLMNDKLEELGISDTTHFTNCIGLYNEEHYTTPYDMAVILKAAMDNPICREILSTHTYTTGATTQHPEGITLSNWFLRRIEDKDCGGEVVAAKTGFVDESRNCAASLAKDADGHEYICVTAGSTSSWRCIYDQVAIYSKFFLN